MSKQPKTKTELEDLTVHCLNKSTSLKHFQPPKQKNGCDDPFAIFGFLAFLLALLQLLVDSGGEERKKRSTYQCSHEQALKNSPELKEGVLGAYIMFQGFLNAVDVGRDHNFRV